MKPLLYTFLIGSSLLCLFISCKKDSETTLKDIQTDCWRRTDGQILFTPLGVSTISLPSKIAVHFKLDDRNGQPIAGLLAEDFNIYEQTENNACLQAISPFEAERMVQQEEKSFTQHTLILLDLSGSVLNNFREEVQLATKVLVNEINPSDSIGINKVGIWWFDGASALHPLIEPTTDKESILESIDRIKIDLSQDNSTNLYGAMQTITQQANDLIAEATGIAGASILLFTDGKDRANRVSKQVAYEAVDSSDAAVSFFAVGLGEDINESDLEKFGRDKFVGIQEVNQLSNTFKDIAQSIENEANSYYFFEYCSPIRSGDKNVFIIEAVQGEHRGYMEGGFNATGFEGGCSL